MRMPYTELYEQIKFSSLINAIAGYYSKLERDYQTTWEQTRFTTFHLVNIQLAKKDKLRHYTDFVKFPWENKTSTVKLSAAEFRKLIRDE
jgi:hypothetical protein